MVIDDAWMLRIALALTIVPGASQSSVAKSLPANARTMTVNGEVQARVGSRFQQGELVRLRSGSPLMTVNSIEGDEVICMWTTEFGEFSTGTFPVAALVAVGGPGGPKLPAGVAPGIYRPGP